MKKNINCKWRAVFLHFSILVFLPGSLISNDSTYLGQEPPGTEPEIFAPGIISLEDRFEEAISFSPDGKQCCFGVTNSNWSWSTLLYTQEDDGSWPTPDTIFFQDDYDAWTPYFSPDGQKLLFSSTRPDGSVANIWMSECIDESWSEPFKLEFPVNTSQHEWRSTCTYDGTLYLISRRDGGFGGPDLYKSELVNGEYLSVENLGVTINTASREASPFIAPDESYLIFESDRSGGYGQGDLYISFKTGDGGWSEPQNMGPTINTGMFDDGPVVSADGKYFFFHRRSASTTSIPSDIYWVDAGIIEQFRPDTTTSNDTTYLGQEPPGTEPEIFAPGIISLEDRFETYLAFSPDGKELFFTVTNAAWSAGKILHTKEEDGTWPEPDTLAFFDNDYINWESFISPDGQRMFFTSNRPTSLSMDIWMIENISDTSWSGPVRLDEPVNSSAADGSACVTDNGTLYFHSRRGGGTGGSTLFRSVPDGGIYPDVESLGGLINTGYGEGEPYMSRDESYLIFISETRSGGQGGWDLWICFEREDGSWTDPVNMGHPINTTDDEYGPRVTHDGDYLFFTREERGQTMDIYWVDANIIEVLRSQHVTGVSTNVEDNKLYIYPNPADNTITVKTDQILNAKIKFTLFSIQGEIIEQGSLMPDNSIDVSEYEKGIYILNLNINGNIIINKKIIIK